MATSTSRSGSSDPGPRRPRRTAVPTSADVGEVEGRTFRSSGQTAVCAVMAVLWPLVLVGLALGSARDPMAAVVLGAAGVVGGLLYARAALMRLDVDDEGLTVVGFVTRHTVPWDDVVGVVAGYDGLRVLRAEGRPRILHSISRSRRSVTLGTPSWADAVADRLTEEARARQAR